ncbi:MAG: MBL fold metallo-hydrolase [Smithella sp.]|jgi:glyoxylase-like metal-dependent hydrolase (beta-lactamase superfamily II)
MKRLAEGKIHERINAIPNAWYPAYIIRGYERNMMIDAGVNLLGPQYLASIKATLADPGLLDYLFLTHSHYDHIGSASYLMRHIPGLKVGAHERLAGLLQKSSVLEMMNRLSGNHVELSGHNAASEDLTMRPFKISFHLKQGDEFNLGGLTCRVYETPGHTRDSLAFYFPEIETLFPGESCGVIQGEAGDIIQVEFLSSYQDYIDSLNLMISLEPEMICLGHGLVLTGNDAKDFLRCSLEETYLYREMIEAYLNKAHSDVEKATRNMAHQEYDIKGGIFQERNAYITNLGAQVRHIAGMQGQGVNPD